MLGPGVRRRDMPVLPGDRPRLRDLGQAHLRPEPPGHADNHHNLHLHILRHMAGHDAGHLPRDGVVESAHGAGLRHHLPDIVHRHPDRDVHPGQRAGGPHIRPEGQRHRLRGRHRARVRPDSLRRPGSDQADDSPHGRQDGEIRPGAAPGLRPVLPGLLPDDI